MISVYDRVVRDRKTFAWDEAAAGLRRDALRLARRRMPELDRGGWTLRYERRGRRSRARRADAWLRRDRRDLAPSGAGARRRTTACSPGICGAHGASGSPDEPIDDRDARRRSRGGRRGGGRRAGARARPLRRRRRHDAVRARPSRARPEPRAGRHRERVQRARARLVRVARRHRGDARRRGAARRSSARATRTDAPPEPHGFARISRAMGGLHTAPLTRRARARHGARRSSSSARRISSASAAR